MSLFFTSAGRMGRLAFLFAVAVLVAVFWAYERFVTGAAHLLTGWLVHLLLVFCACSVLSKRLHDRGRSGWWSALILVAFLFAWPWPRGLSGALGAAGLFATALDLGLLPGETRFNAYGAPPG